MRFCVGRERCHSPRRWRGRRALLGALALFAAGSRADATHDIEVDEHRLHIECSGRGAPAVVLDVGLGGSALEWVFVVERLRGLTEVCTYDRAGYGASDMGPLPRTSSRIAAELEQLLVAAKVQPPYVLVGHSFGGYNMQLFARRHPEKTAGLVLVDASHPDQAARFEAPPLNIVTAPSSRAGIVQFREHPMPNRALPPRLQAEVMAAAAHWKARRTVSAELLSFRDSGAEVGAAPPLGALPLVVISRGRIDGELTPKRLLFEQTWLDMQSELAAGSRVSAHLVALASGHHVHLEQPDLVVYAAGLLVARARGAGPVAQWMARHDGGALHDATWLKDDLSLFPATKIAARAPLHAVP